LPQPAHDWSQTRDRNFDRMMDLIFSSHPYYRARFAEAGLDRSDVRSLADIVKLPLTSKTDYMSSPEDFRLRLDDRHELPVPERTLANVIYTTGSTAGHPTPFYDTNFDNASRIAQMKEVAQTLGLGPSDVIANLFPLTPVLHQGFLSALYAGLASGAKVFATCTGQRATEFPIYNDTAYALDLLRQNHPTVLWGIVSYVRRIVAMATASGVDLSSVRLAFIAGEPASPAVQRELAAVLEQHGAVDVRVENGYGFTEMQGPGVRCTPDGLVHIPGRVSYHVEVLHPTTLQPVDPGAEGLIAISHLNRRGTVLLRYLVGDLCAIRDDACEHCGEAGPRLVSAPRRTGQLLKIKGTLVNTGALVNCLDDIPGLLHSQVRIRPPAPGDGFTEQLLVYVITADDRTAEISARVRDTIRSTFEVTPDVQPAPLDLREELVRRYKVRRMIDERVAEQ
jgi:phenylacetate-CoA ligase